MLKKEEVFVRVSSKKKARKLKELLDMFGECTGSQTFELVKNGGDIYYNIFGNCWCASITSSLNDKTKVSLKELRNILAVEHLKKGDVVIVYNNPNGGKYVLRITDNSTGQFEHDISYSYELDYIDFSPWTIKGGNFIRYATEEEKALLEPKKELEVGKWYNVGFEYSGRLFALINITNIVGDIVYYYGFDEDKWCNEDWFRKDLNYSEATPQEVEEALIKEAKRRYKVGDKLSKVYDDYSKGDGIFSLNLSHQVGLCDLWIDDDNGYSYCIFKNGKWAEVIKPEKSLEERVKELEEAVFKATINCICRDEHGKLVAKVDGKALEILSEKTKLR